MYIDIYIYIHIHTQISNHISPDLSLFRHNTYIYIHVQLLSKVYIYTHIYKHIYIYTHSAQEHDDHMDV